MPAVVLAGERPGGNLLARAHGLAAGVLVPVAGRACIARVIDTLRASGVAGGLIVGPTPAIAQSDPVLAALLAPGDFTWLAPADGPSASALAGVAALERYPVLLTAGDHALLTPAMVARFCALARATPADFVVGLVPHALVRSAFPESRRTVLRFRDGAFCGSNLFLLQRPAARAALTYWRRLEAERKRPWRMARHLGAGCLVRYLAGRLTLADALARLSDLAGCRIGHVCVEDARAAVDVDSDADLRLAERLLAGG
jgi:hypothetical protein